MPVCEATKTLLVEKSSLMAAGDVTDGMINSFADSRNGV